MTIRMSLPVLAAGSLMLAAMAPAFAGGFTQGSADVSILFEDERFAVRSGVTVVSPTRRYSRNPGNPALEGTDYAATYEIPSFAVKADLTDQLRCAGTYAKPLGGHAEFDSPKNAAQPKPVAPGIANAGKLDEEFSIYEMGLTCAVSFAFRGGEAWLLAGAFRESFAYDRLDILISRGLPGVPDGSQIGEARLAYDQKQYGYRLGAAYEIPDMALRAALVYRSGTSYDPEGELEIDLPTGVSVLDAYGLGDMPQSIELTVQSGMAESWLAFGAVRWTDWSVVKEFLSQSYWSPGVPGPGSVNEYYWRDGWTVSGGMAHEFDEHVSGLLAVTWDRGVATGYDHASENWTVTSGVALDCPWGGILNAGGALSYIAASEESRYGAANTAVEAGWAYALNVGYRVAW
ncbi:aromatic hydrocarbon degradation protein [Nordella sp. HKS 07]|uniref:outer membrane protein transport protein n=1 Tax=Nordella sp. HKS 07 TaxID=2712222 RepID=UPI0013E1345C|nr:outer membrane protein transport protein [Nordella sp. HKS 07]QIG47371.1 aromatic hydrocarbon degradation protein [Nordella sp. HKS 07]